MARLSKFGIPEDEYELTPRRKFPQIDVESREEIIKLPIDKLVLDSDNSTIYGDETDESIDKLAYDIMKNGFKGAILAYPVTVEGEPKYRIESGHRRYLAAKYADLTEIPVIVTKTPVTDSERRIRLISMNLHSRGTLKPTIMAKVIETLMDSNKAEQERKGNKTDLTTLTEIVSSQVELSTQSIDKYRQFSRLSPKLQQLADDGISWSALTQAISLPEEKQETLALSIKTEIEHSGIDSISRQWVLSMIARIKYELYNEPGKTKTVLKRRDGAKIISKCLKDFEDIVNGKVIFKESNKKETIENLKKLRETIDKQISEFEQK